MATSLVGFAQVGVGTTSPQAALDISSTNSGLLVPRLANGAAVTTPVNGMIIYDLSSNEFNYFQNGQWTNTASLLGRIGAAADRPDVVNCIVTVAELGTIVPLITGLVPANEILYQDYIDTAGDSFSNPATTAELQTMVNEVNDAVTLGIPYVVSVTGQTWMDRNLGATQVATSSTDAASLGNLYQWGRGNDGHEDRASLTGNILYTAGDSTHDRFITNTVSPFDWRSALDDTLWNTGTEAAPVKTATDPCPTGYCVPTVTELDAERSQFPTQDFAGLFASDLKLPSTSYRKNDGSVVSPITVSMYWTSSISQTDGNRAMRLFATPTLSDINDLARAYGASVRCIKE